MNASSYHERTKHGLDKYAAGPETLDWSMQPDPYREFSGTERILLPLPARALKTGNHVPSIESIGALLQLSMGLSAWKEYGPDKWALRCNPSSGNLHPTECYILALNVPGIGSGLHHYRSLEHCLEKRCEISWEGETRLFVGLSSIHWREAWKYGERAFRYCQLDVGHALGSLAYAAAILGWSIRLTEAREDILGTTRIEDFRDAENEEHDLLLEVDFGHGEKGLPDLEEGRWNGKANRIDPYPMYSWPIIESVAASTKRTKELPVCGKIQEPPVFGSDMVEIVLGRRSAQRFDPSFTMEMEDFHAMLLALLPENGIPWGIWGFEPNVHPVFFVHRVRGLQPGLYALPRSENAAVSLRKNLRQDFLWEKTGPQSLPLFLLAQADCRNLAKVVSCRQSIASDSCFSLGMLAEFREIVATDPWRYRQLHWEAGLVGHVLYLEAEMAGLRGTGIGCFFDDAFHEVLGLANDSFQSLYHFTVGMPMIDSRISTLSPYSERQQD